jgi:pilus assembly protein CpaB
MAQRRYSLILVAALAVAAAATFVVNRALNAARTENEIQMQPIIVAAEDVPEGASLTRESLREENWPSTTVPDGAFSSIDSAMGRVARVPIYVGEPIIPGRLAPVGTGPGLQAKVTPGKRAMAVKIDDVAGLSGLIQPNSRVDVLVTIRAAQDQSSQVAKLFMENMRVLAVGTVVTSGPDNRPINATTATLEVIPEEAERLALAMREGSIQLVLRGFGDPSAIRTPGARTTDVLAQLRSGQPVITDQKAAPARTPVRRRVIPPPKPDTEPTPVAAPAPVVAPPPPPPVVVEPPPKPDSHTVNIYRGEKVTTQKFVKPDTTRRKPPWP